MKRGAKMGCFYGLSALIVQLTIGITFYSVYRIQDQIQDQNFIDVIIALMVPMWSGVVAGNSFFFIMHATAGKTSAIRIFELLDSNSEADQQRTKGEGTLALPPEEIKGKIEFKRVSFRYRKTRKYVLQDVSFVIEAGQKAAFVGESGCGKSTIMLLLQRFYDYEGEILLDGVNILNYDLAAYRNYFAVLNQEPSLFTGTLRDNVLFGSQVEKAQLDEACKLAFVYDMNQAWKGQSV